jgi:C4-dicarboxylate-specific signal transduction histidine kinase
LPSTATVDVHGCVFSYICYSYSFVSIDLCSKLDLQSSDGNSSCPSAGTYSFDSTFNTPGDGSWEIPSWLDGYTVTVTATIIDSETSTSSTTCSLKVATQSSSSSYTMVEASAAALAVFGTAFWIRRRRKTRTSARIHLLELECTAQSEEELAQRAVPRLTIV